MTTIYFFELNENKYYITEFKNHVIEPIKEMVQKLVPENDFDKIKSLLTQHAGETLSSLEWIKKYPIKTIAQIKENSNLEKVSIYYIKEYGIDNLRSDMFKDIELSSDVNKYVQNILINSDEPIPVRIKLIDEEINKLKSTFDFITENNVIIEKYLNYMLELNIPDVEEKQKHYINILIPNFIDNYMKSISSLFLNINHNIIFRHITEHFSNHKIIEEISNTLLLQKKNEKLIFKYGTLDELNKKLTSLLYRKIELIRMLEMDDIQEENDVEEEEEEEDDEEEDDEEEEDEEEKNKCNDCGESTVELVLINDKPTLKCLNCDA